MKKYIIKAAKHEKDDTFGFKEATEHLYFFAEGLKDLRNTIRCITPIGYNVRTPQWFAKYLRDGEMVMKNPLLLTIMYEIREIDQKIKINQELEYTNKHNFRHNLKFVTAENWK